MKTIRILTLLTVALCGTVNAEPIPEAYRQNGWFIGAQAWTFREFTTFEAIAKTKEAGGKIIEIYPGQTLKPGSDVKVHHTMPEEAIVELLAECERQGLRCVNYGVVGANDAAEVKTIMAFAKRLGLYAISTESAELVAAWEAAAIENDVKVAFHQHGGTMSNPKYKVWHPLYIRGLVEGRDERLGASADIGHWRTSHLDSVECLRILEGRIISVHFKDKEKDGNAPVVTVGTGVVNVAACLEELKRQNFDGHLSVEHENHWNDNVSHVKAAIDFVKANPK
jgi:sugar phosphate isomerase/epimerase